MPIHWTASHPTKLVVAVCKGPLTRKDIEGYLDAVVVADTLAYRKIFDMTEATTPLPDEDIMALGARIRAYATMGQMGPRRRKATNARICSPRSPTRGGRSRSSASFTPRGSGSTRRHPAADGLAAAADGDSSPLTVTRHR
jgi:hypothetical protein